MHSNPYKWTREHLNYVITEGKHKALSNSLTAEAFRIVDRADFVPPQLKEMAYADSDVEIGYGENLTRASTIARILEILQPGAGGRYLEIGSGTGYLLSILSQIAGRDGQVIGLERILNLVQKARNKVEKYGSSQNIEIVFKDGRAGYEDMGPFSGIISSASFQSTPEHLKPQLRVGGKLIFPTTAYDLVVVTRTDKDTYKEEIHNGFIFAKIKEGVE